MKIYEKPVAEIIELITEEIMGSGEVGPGFGSGLEEGAGPIPGM